MLPYGFKQTELSVKQPCVYIIANRHDTTLYIGVTSNLVHRIYQHRNKLISGFSQQYNLTKLVYFELHQTLESAITREKRLKKWQRKWKERLINDLNPWWCDLYEQIL